MYFFDGEKINMKFDMHCHTKEGSIDGKVSIQSFVAQLKRKGFDGMLLTDHNSYKGYQKWAAHDLEERDAFTVLKGVEYDTRDGGHVIAVLPDGVHCKLLELRGLSLAKLEKVVHRLGGILGPAHPYGTGFFALMNNGWVKKHKAIIGKFDFIEAFNGCTHSESNKRAKKLAYKYNKPQFAGSDAHTSEKIGSAYTIFNRSVSCNNDLIRLVKEKDHIKPKLHPDERIKCRRESVFLKIAGIIGYWIYNKGGAIIYTYARIKEVKAMGSGRKELGH